MNCLMIFDHSNDLIYTKYNNISFEEHFKKLAISQGLLPKDDGGGVLDKNVLIQIFSPIVSSHQIMHYQFGNSYTSITLNNDLKLHFYEFMGFLFISIDDDMIENLIDIYVTLAKYLCGPDIYQLQLNQTCAVLYTQLIDKWMSLHNTEQSVLVEAIEQLIVNNDITSTCLQSLKDSITKLAVHENCSKVHALLFVDMKFLSLYSSSNAKQLSSSDILFILLLTQNSSDKLQSFKVFLSGSEIDNKCLPHSVHIVRLFEKLSLVYLIEDGDPLVSVALYETSLHLHKLRFIQAQREKESIQLGFENLEIALRRLNDAIKKTKMKSLSNDHKKLLVKWDVLKGKYKDYLKSTNDEDLLRAETLSMGFLDNLKELYSVSVTDNSVLNSSAAQVETVIPNVSAALGDFGEYFKVRGMKNFSLGSYLEEFPGLVHFLYIDRNTNRVTTPSLDMDAEKAEFIRERIWSMVSLARSHLQQGHTAVIWKDKIFTYGYFLWFEDSGGEGLKLTTTKSTGNKTPGILGENYYMKLKAAHFPKVSPVKIRVYELYVMHLGLVTPSAVLEQARVLSSTVWELKGFPTHAIDLL
ncbi:BLOC-3 complex member HPS1 isoform X2 [Euwallacea fornicatus]|uniref:BLOC-3 complex member HPS1 isoform X2 n=1 Tax=Euwallacea fornicatus TaxID=995702 RepID=UPI00338EC077